mgnify:CR=1 FL=1
MRELNEKLIFAEYDALGLTVGSEEIFSEIKRGNPVLTQYFTNPQTGRVYDQLADPVTGGLNAQAVLGAVKCLSYPIFLSFSSIEEAFFNILNNVDPEPL